MTSSHLLARLGLAALAGAAVPAMAARVFINKTESPVCLVPDPDRLPSAGMVVTPGAGCQIREVLDEAEARAGQEEARASSAQAAPIVLRRLWPDWARTVLYLAPGGSVTFAVGPGRTGPQAARFQVGTPRRAGQGTLQVLPEHLVVAFAATSDPEGGLAEDLDGRELQPDEAEPWPGRVYSFQSGGDDRRDLCLVDRPASAACTLL